MKKSILRVMIREEVAKAIQEVITELKQPTLEKKLKKKKVISEKQNFTSNKILNGVLNETANNINEWEIMGGTKYTSDRMGEIVGNSYKDLIGDNQLQNGGVVVDGKQPDFLKKDYRAIMNAVEKKRGG